VALRLWLGFPKSLDISKAIDKQAGAEREVVGTYQHPDGKPRNIDNHKANKDARIADQEWGMKQSGFQPITAPATPEAQEWDGWGTALKPANEPIVLARKPLSEKTVAENVLKWGTGGLNIDGCRIPTDPTVDDPRLGGKGSWKTDKAAKKVYEGGYVGENIQSSALGRFPANVILDEEAGRMLDEQSGISKSRASGYNWGESNNDNPVHVIQNIKSGLHYDDKGGASRFFYCAKASRKERGEFNKHPTVKPIALMEYLIKLVTPPEGIVLDPFLGSGTTALAALNLGRFFIGIEFNEEYCEIARRRIEQHKTRIERR